MTFDKDTAARLIAEWRGKEPIDYDLEERIACQLEAACAEVERIKSTEHALNEWHATHGKNAELCAECDRLAAEVERMRERAENAETALVAPEVHWECRQKIDALESVFEAAKAWGRTVQRSWTNEYDRALIAAIDSALAERGGKP